ncbi:MAG: endonuclease III domain-containing protein [Budvicia sp.]|nr:endonuclease III domain-containing protein [Budvicia sp.]
MLSVPEIYQRLFERYGQQHWWPAESAYEMLVGAVLTQNTHWRNVEKALGNLGNQLKPQVISAMPHDQLANLLRPSGYYNQKAERLRLLSQWFIRYDCDVNAIRRIDGALLRHTLLSLKGVGRETADCMLVYAFDKPFFIIDTYTRRLFSRIGYDVPESYEHFRLLIEQQLPPSVELYNEYHALIVALGKEHCAAKPCCSGCPLERDCHKTHLNTLNG